MLFGEQVVAQRSRCATRGLSYNYNFNHLESEREREREREKDTSPRVCPSEKELKPSFAERRWILTGLHFVLASFFGC